MAKNTPAKDLTYEQAFEELEKIIEALEGEQHSLEEAIALFERSQALANRCAELLDKADLKVQQLTEEGERKDFED